MGSRYDANRLLHALRVVHAYDFDRASHPGVPGTAAKIGPQPSAILDRLYSLLTVLDSKAASLLTINSIAVASVGVFLVVREKFLTYWKPALASGFVSVLLLGLSAWFCFSVIRIEWHFLERAAQKIGAAEVDHDAGDKLIEHEAACLAETVVKRTNAYDVAWRCSLLGAISAGLMILCFFAAQR